MKWYQEYRNAGVEVIVTNLLDEYTCLEDFQKDFVDIVGKQYLLNHTKISISQAAKVILEHRLLV